MASILYLYQSCQSAIIGYSYFLSTMKKPEILAPAGSFETLQAAINAGADAVYFGIADFNMRATAAKNFTLGDLPEIVQICRKAKVKTYVTVNTLLYNNELEKMRKIIDAIKRIGISAIIAADMATIEHAREKGVEIHISTQLSISNTESLKFYSQFADRVVLARELSLEQVKKIVEDIKEQKIKGPGGKLVEIEVFTHGALCVAVSGRCAMSLYCYNRSANRGKCTQMCRRRYKITDIETGKELEVDNNYVLSPADLCTIGMLPELIDAGVNVLKFEGRGRPPEYVDTVIRTYRQALEAIEKGEYGEDKIKEWTKELKKVYNRGFSTGLYMGRKGDEWAGIHGSKATQEKLLIGVVQKYYPKIQVIQIEIQAKSTIKEGEKFIITGPTTGIIKGKLAKMQIDEKLVKEATQNNVITFKIKGQARKNDKFFVVRKRKSLIPRGKESFLKD